MRRLFSSFWRGSVSAWAALAASLPVGGLQAQSIEWPAFGPDRGFLHFKGIANAAPDFVGPIDGSATLTIFTEGNHFPVLLPLVLDGFPAWCRSTGACAIEASRILVVTLPQPMVVDILLKGGVRLGNAVLPVGPRERVFPDFVMGGNDPLRRLAAEGVVERTARVFARHRDLGLLVRQELAGVSDLRTFHASVRRLVIASQSEAGARSQYRATLDELIGRDLADEVMGREVRTFAGRLGIQHRDVPYSVFNGLADGGIIFTHLAAFYARSFPDRLRFVEVPAAEPFGQEIAMARTTKARTEAAGAFERFFMDAARTAYPSGGFTATTGFEFGRELVLAAR